MNEVGSSESGTGLRAIKSSRSSDANFEYDDSEWDVGIGNLIIDLDADIEKNNEANRNNNNSNISSTNSLAISGALSSGGSPVANTTSGSSNTNSNLSSVTSSAKIGGGSSSNPQMHIPLTSSSGSNSNNSSNNGSKSGKASSVSGNSSSSSSLPKGSSNSSSSAPDLSSVMEHSSVVDKGLKMKIKRTKTGTKSGADAKHEIVKNDVVGSSNGTTSGSSSASGYAGNKSLSDSISSKNSHSSHKDKDNKLLIKDGLHHDNLHDSGVVNNATTGNKQDSLDHTPGGKVKTPRKGSTKEKKVKNNNSNVGNSGGKNKDDKSNDSANSKSLSNSGSGNNSGNSNSSASSGTHAKDNKEFFSTTVNLNVPNVIPNSSSSAFVKATATIKVPTAPSSSAASVLSTSSSGSTVHSSGGDSTSSSSSSSNRSQNLSSANNSSNNTPWGTVSPNKGTDKGRLSPSAAAEKATAGNSYKKARAFAASEKSGSNQDENSGSHGSTSTYRNQGALSINSATDLSTSSSNFIQGVPGSQSGGNGSSFGSSTKETGKAGRSAATSTPTSVDVCVGTSVGTVTEPDCFGPCEPGSSVTLEGIVWHETESGVLAVNVTWRGKTYVGALIDCTKSDWAPPRFCDSPSSDLETRTPKNRGKRGRAQTATPVNEPVVADTRSGNAKLRNGAKGRRGSNTAAAFVAPASPVKPDPWPKRKTRGSENESQEDPNPKNAKRLKVSKDSDRKERRSNSPGENEKSGPSSPQLIECPEPNCSKKYKHINGLRYHQSHAHSNNFVAAEDSDSNLSTASNTNASVPADPSTSTSTDNSVEPMAVDNGPDAPDNGTTGNAATSSAPNSAAEESPPAPSTPGKKPTTPPATATTPAPKVDDKIYDLSTDADLNPSKDSNSQTQETPEPYSSSKSNKAATTVKSQIPGKETSGGAASDQNSSKLTPENLSKDSSSSATSTSTTPTTTTTTPTLTPRTPILTVPVVPYMSLERSRNLVHGHVVNVPRVETSLSSRESSENNSPLKNSVNQGSVPTSKGAPWQPHAHSQSGLSSHSSHVMNTSPPTQSSITVPLNIPMSIPGGGVSKDKEKNNLSDQPPPKKSKHKKKSKDKDKERDGKSKCGDKDRQDMGNGKNSNVQHSGGPSDYSRSSGMFHNSGSGPDSMGRSKDVGSDESESSRKNSLENREDPQSPAYSDISDANDSGPDNELNVGSAIKDSNCKGLVIPGEIKKDPINVPGPVGPPYQSYLNHNFHSPYLDSLSYASNPAAPAARQGKDGAPNISDEADKNRPGGPVKHPNLPPNPQVPPAPGVGNDESRRSPKLDFHQKYPFPNYFSYPYSGYHYDHPTFGNPNPMPSDSSFSAPGQGRMFPGMEDKDVPLPSVNAGKDAKPGEKDEGPGMVQIKQEPVEREERRGKDRQSSSMPLNLGEDKNVEIKREYGTEHVEPKLVPPYMTNSSSKHSSKDHNKANDERHERRHEGKDHHSKSDSVKSGRNSSSNDKNKGSSVEESEPKERKDEGSKPTMETTGPPPPPTASAYYLPQSYLPGNPFGLPFDHPLYRNVQLVPGPYPGSPYMHPGSIPRFPTPGGPTPLPEDLSRPSPPGPPTNSAKALDLLQHHAAQYYTSHKIHELQERALKSPSPQVASAQRGERDGPISGPGGAPAPSPPGGHPLGVPGGVGHPMGGGRSSVGSSSASAMPKPADLSKDAKPTIGPGGSILPGGANSDNGRTPPPTQHHVHSHTHHHTHVGIGYPIIPTVPPQYSPHYGVLATPPAAPSVIPPFPSPKSN